MVTKDILNDIKKVEELISSISNKYAALASEEGTDINDLICLIDTCINIYSSLMSIIFSSIKDSLKVDEELDSYFEYIEYEDMRLIDTIFSFKNDLKEKL